MSDGDTPRDPSIRDDVLSLAAISYLLDPEAIAATMGIDVPSVVKSLFPEVVTERDSSGAPRWVLKPAIRRACLADPDIRYYAGRYRHDAVDPTERILRDWLDGALGNPASLLAEKPAAIRRVAGWLLDCRWVTPRPAEVMALVGLDDVRRRFEHSASPSFVGRTGELERLKTSLTQGTRVEVLEARGGMGKSALIAQHLLTTGAFTPGGKLGLVLDFDDPGLSVERLDVLFLELARQATVQGAGFEDMERELRDAVDAARASGKDSEYGQESYFDDSRIYTLAELLFDRLQGLGRRVVIVLDTVERAYHVAPGVFAQQMGWFVQSVASRPQLALLIAGRGPISIPAIHGQEPLVLGPLDKDDAP
jgi:hypothetical protein